MYTREYYTKHDTASYQSAKAVLTKLSSYIKPHSVIDLGCGSGTWCRAAAELWEIPVTGIDQHAYYDCHMHIPETQYRQLDIRKELCNYRAELTICVEVIEHIDEAYEDIVLDNICSTSDNVLFSGALPFQGGTGHINEKPYSYWVDKFSARGFGLDERLRNGIWHNDAIAIWYRNNIMLLQKNNYRPKLNSPLDIIHPDMLKRILGKQGVL